jgi:hypothetical protein
MEDNELLLNMRQVVRDEMTLAIEPLTQRMNSHFDRIETRFHDLFARFDRYESELVSLRSDFDRVGTSSPTSPLVTSNRA